MDPKVPGRAMIARLSTTLAAFSLACVLAHTALAAALPATR